MAYANQSQWLRLSRFFMAPGIQEGNVWIGRLSEDGRDEGEGGDFQIEQVSTLIEQFYRENF